MGAYVPAAAGSQVIMPCMSSSTVGMWSALLTLTRQVQRLDKKYNRTVSLNREVVSKLSTGTAHPPPSPTFLC